MRGSKIKHLVGRKWKLLTVWSDCVRGEYIFSFRTVDEPVHLVVQLSATGRVELMRSGLIISMKPDRRRKVTDVAHKALAYCTLTGSVEGFPEQELL